MTALTHDVEQKEDGTYHCRVCLWSWPRPPTTECPGFARLRAWSDVPAGWVSRTQLLRWGLRPNGDPVGLLILSDQGAVWLYKLDKARIPRSRTPAQLAALAKYRNRTAAPQMEDHEA